MKKKLRISSLIENVDEHGLTDRDAEREDFTVTGELDEIDGGFRIAYREEREGNITECEISARGEKVSVRRTGAVECLMHFKSGMTHKTVYSVPPFSFNMTIETVRVDNELSPEGGGLSLLYKMSLGGAEKRCRFRLFIL